IMDETFEKVDFSYTCKTTGTKKEIQTLEIIEYGPKDESQAFETAAEKPVADKPEAPVAPQPEVGQKIIRDNQTGISYEKLFGKHLVGATEIRLIDPYIR